jgi:hypothetical protein
MQLDGVNLGSAFGAGNFGVRHETLQKNVENSTGYKKFAIDES